MCRGLRPRRVRQVLAISHLLVLPSAFRYGVGPLIYENYAAQYPARLYPCQRFACSLATGPAHDSGPVWVAGPSPYGSFIRTSTPVYPGAHPNISSIKTSTMIISSNSLSRGSGMLYQLDDALLHAMSGIELSRVRTELRLLLPEAYQQKSDRVERGRHCYANQVKFFKKTPEKASCTAGLPRK